MRDEQQLRMVIEPSSPGWIAGDGWWDEQLDTLVDLLCHDRFEVEFIEKQASSEQGYRHKGGFDLAIQIGRSSVASVLCTFKTWLSADDQGQRRLRIKVPHGNHFVELEVSSDDIDLEDMKRALLDLLAATTSLAPDIPLLFLGANPAHSSQLALDAEFQCIRAALSAAPQGARFALHPYWHVHPRDLAARVVEHSPKLVHFCGHGTELGELVFEGHNRDARPAAPEVVAELFAHAQSVRCVVLSACYSDLQAEAIARHVDWVVGMSGAVPDELVLEFCAGFYRALGHGRSIAESFELARIETKLDDLPEHHLLTLFGRDRSNPHTHMLA